MASTLTVNKQLVSDRWVVTANLSPGGTLPLEIFVFTNTGTTQLGTYEGVIAATELSRIQIFTGTAIPVFANKFVRYGTATLYVGLDRDPDSVITVLKNSVQYLSTTYQSIQNSTQVFTIT